MELFETQAGNLRDARELFEDFFRDAICFDDLGSAVRDRIWALLSETMLLSAATAGKGVVVGGCCQ